MVQLLNPFLPAMIDNNHTYPRRHSQPSKQNGIHAADISTRVSELSLSNNPFRNVPTSSYLLLLTPYLHNTPAGLPSTSGIDPFEPFGRNLTQYHSNIRHVPYVAKYGIIDIHKQHIASAGGVIVLACPSSSSELEDNEVLDHIDDQIAFAEDASELIEEADVPGLLVTVGSLNRDEQIRFWGAHLQVNGWIELATAAERVYNAS
jgi:hypothetical protein